jgi:hypothetical protein
MVKRSLMGVRAPDAADRVSQCLLRDFAGIRHSSVPSATCAVRGSGCPILSVEGIDLDVIQAPKREP